MIEIIKTPPRTEPCSKGCRHPTCKKLEKKT